MDDMNCGGKELDISDCGFGGWGQNNCGHSEDIGVICEPLPYLQLISGNSTREGFLQLVKDGTVYPVCDEGITDSQINQICGFLGYRNRGHRLSTKVFDTHAQYYRATLTSCDDNMMCTSQPFSATSCIQGGGQLYIRCSDPDEIRLVGGRKASEGRIEWLHNGIWGSVCSQNFSDSEAEVLCRSLGFLSGNATVHRGGTFGHTTQPEVVSDIQCQGTEADVSNCTVTYSERPCSPGEEVGVSCDTTPTRLMGGNGPWEGRIEIQRGGHWMEICQDHFNQSEAEIVCKMLGFPDRVVQAEIKPNGFYGRGGSGHVAYVLHCRGGLSDIAGCAVTTGCPSGLTVGMRCHTKDIRLQGGSHPLEGRVEVRVQGQWRTVCDEGWDDLDATTVCRMLTDFPIDGNVTGTAYKTAFFGKGTGRVAMSRVDCSGSEVSLFSCPADMTGGVNCDHARDAGVSCSVNNRAVLVGTSQSPSTGTVGLIQGDRWYSACDQGWSAEDARVVCRSMGLWSSSPTIYKDAWFGQSNGTSLNIEPDCKGSEVDLAFCPLNKEWGNETCSHSDDAGVACYPTALGFHNVRLSDGDDIGHGRLEVYYNGNWGSVCLDQWNQNNTNVVCKMLHYNSNGTFFQAPQGDAPVLVNSMGCHGDETDVGYCTADLKKDNCRQKSVGVDCTDGMKARNTSGRVQIYRDGAWGEVCSDHLSDNEAKVLCSMMGYRQNTGHLISGPAHPSGDLGTVSVVDLQCDGWEEHIQQCSFLSSGACSSVGAHVQCIDCRETFNTTTGNVTSRGYPHGYPESDCIYVITPPNNTHHIYKLSINDLEIKSTGDSLHISEGYNGLTLASFSGGMTNTELVAGREFVVRFKSDAGSPSLRGFDLQWSPLQLEDAITVNCDTTSWRIVVNMTLLRLLYPDSGVSQIYLNKQSCYGHVVDDTVVFDQSYSNCSTSKSISDKYVTYTNQLVYPESSTPFPLIVHGYRWRVDVNCNLDRYEHVTQHYKPTDAPPTQTTIHHQVGGSGHYDIDLQFFTDPQYFHEILGNPVTANIGENIYVKVSLNNDDFKTKMRLDTCLAKPEAVSTPQNTYAIIKNGCSVDPSTQIVSQGTHETRFLFNAFVFPSNQNAVYISCNATFCSASDLSMKCSQTCHHKRLSLFSQFLNLFY
uniref:Scavenger receptor cysteine-rich domain-containing protein DMBT1 n=1 Tax=Crassostrea virginica TaxID=6565 RepID=A0A8B8E113_CRAVI|nr:deleted in malignant brain tumors 1 protein-like [Crassostrea virginica]